MITLRKNLTIINKESRILNPRLVNNLDGKAIDACDVYVIHNIGEEVPLEIVKKESFQNGDMIIIEEFNIPEYRYYDGKLIPAHTFKD